MLSSRFFCTTFLLAALAPRSFADILTVGPAGSGAQFTQIQAAIDAAAAGDVILVKPGTYHQIVVDKPLRILGDGSGIVRISGSGPGVSIHDVGAGELVLSAVEVVVTSDSVDETLLLQDCLSRVVLQDVTVPDTLKVGVQVENCKRVLILDSHVRAGSWGAGGAVYAVSSEVWLANDEITGLFLNSFAGFSAAPGVGAVNSTLHVWRSRIQGGGGDVQVGPKMGSPGAAGIRALGSIVNLFGGSDSEVFGGMGPYDPMFDEAFPGGAGVDLRQNSHARIQADIPIEGGFDGLGEVQTVDIRVLDTSSSTLDPRIFPTLASDALQVQIGSAFDLGLEGNPGGFQIVFAWKPGGPTRIYPRAGAFALDGGTSLTRIASVVLPASGVDSVQVVVPNLSALIGSAFFFRTAERFGGAFALGNPVVVTITG